MRYAAFLLALAALPAAAQYSVQRNGDIVQLVDSAAQTTVSVITSVGNTAFEMKVKGQNALHFTATPEEFRKRPGLGGIPLLAPWANRLDEQAFYANGKKYAFNMELGNVRGKIPMHGFVSSTSDWVVVEAKADAKSAWLTSRLDFYRQPDWMAQWPFAHTIEMTYRLAGGVLEIQTKIENLSSQPMPVALGYHPFFQVTDSTRDDWTVAIGARTEWLLSPDKVPTGETRPIEKFLPNPQAIALKDFDLDHVFGDLVRDSSGRALMSVKGKAQKVEVLFGPKYLAAVVYAPKPGPGAPPPGARNMNFICFEPMTGITNALNMAHRGAYKELQSVPARGTWQESFWVRPSGF